MITPRSNFCPRCGAGVLQGARFCPDCGQAYDEPPAPPVASPAAPPAATALAEPTGWDALSAQAQQAPPKSVSIRPFFAIVGVLLLAYAGWQAMNPAAKEYVDTTGGATVAPVAPLNWQPAGYQLAAGDSSVAWKWDENATCSFTDATCWGIDAIARSGCPSTLYFELSIADSAGTAVGYTNDAVGAVAPGQHAKLTFDTFEEGARTAKVSNVSCY